MSTHQERISKQKQIDAANKSGIFLDHADASGRVRIENMHAFIKNLESSFKNSQ